MRRLRGIFVLMVSLAVGGLAAAAASSWMKARVAREVQKSAESASAHSAPVLVAARELPRGVALRPDDLVLIRMPLPPPLSLSRPEQAMGRVPRVKLYAGEPLLEPKLAAGSGHAGLEAAIPAGLRAMTVKVDEVIGLAGFALPGCKVDVVAVIKPAHSDDAVARVVLQDLEVLAADQGIESTDGKPHPSSAITLLVTPAEAERLALAVTQGKIQLVLRSPGDDAVAGTSGLDAVALLSREPPAPAPRPSALVSVRRPRPEREEKAEPAPDSAVELIENDHRHSVAMQRPQELAGRAPRSSHKRHSR